MRVDEIGGDSPATLGVRMDRVTLSVPADAAFGTTLRLVVGGLGSRTHLSIEQVDELQLAVEAVVAQRAAAEGSVCLEADVDGSELVLRLGPFVPDADQPARRVLAQLVQRVGVVTREGDEWIELSVAGRPAEGGV